MPSNRREHLLDTALSLFGTEGFHATGIDKILAHAGVAKMTLYNHFRSKDELILAALRRRDESFRNWFMRDVERRTEVPRERLLALFDALGDWLARDGITGCMFINAAAEYGDCNHPIHAVAAEHKRLMTGYVRDLAKSAGAADPDRLARQLYILLEGAIVATQVCSRTDAAADARDAAAILIAAAFD
jgi:AcrR family transcriptional regulator